MMSTILNVLLHVALLVGGWKLWRWSKRTEKAKKMRWRRRFASVFFVSPFVFAFLLWLMPEVTLIRWLATVNLWLDAGVDRVIESSQRAVEGQVPFGSMAVKTIVRAVVYGGLGAIIGWPLDRRAAKKAAEQGESAD